MTTPSERRALADRVEAGETSREIELAIMNACFVDRKMPFPWVFSIADTDRLGLIVQDIPDPVFIKLPADYVSVRALPRFLTSLDAAHSVMPEGWVVDVKAWTDRVCVVAFREECAMGFANTECAARVAAGLRARAHVMEVGK